MHSLPHAVSYCQLYYVILIKSLEAMKVIHF